MGCGCGGSPASKDKGSKARRYLTGEDGMVLLRYVGESDWRWFEGLVTGTCYPFGTKRRLGPVDIHDVGEGPQCAGKLLGEREDGRLVFEVADDADSG